MLACTVAKREDKSDSLVSCLHDETAAGVCAALLEGYVYTILCILETAVTPFRMINLSFICQRNPFKASTGRHYSL